MGAGGIQGLHTTIGAGINMDIFSELLEPQRSTTSSFGIVLALIGVGLAGALMIYLLRCYVQEALFRKRVRRRVHQHCGGNIVPAEATLAELSETRQLAKKSSLILPPRHRTNASSKARRHSVHPWKQTRFSVESGTPH
jgi:hypothetical protein